MSSVAPGAHAPGYENATALRLYLSRGVVTRAWVPLLRGFAASSQKDGVDAATCVAASRLVHIVMPVFLGLTPQAMDMPPLRGFTRPPHEDCGPGRFAASPLEGGRNLGMGVAASRFRRTTPHGWRPPGMSIS